MNGTIFYLENNSSPVISEKIPPRKVGIYITSISQLRKDGAPRS